MPDGRILTQSYAILRHWSRCLGAYDGKTEDEKYWVDAVCDIVIDCKSVPFCFHFPGSLRQVSFCGWDLSDEWECAFLEMVDG